jgi:glutamyl-tRNA reductase
VSVVVVGLNHRTVPLDVLERMTVDDARLPKALFDLGHREHLDEVIVLSTCMRTEIYAVADRFHGAIQDVRNFLAEWSGAELELFADHIYSFYDDAAVAHLFQVASGLDSAVLGETEILGQVRDGWERAKAEGTSGAVLSRLFGQAIEVGRRARSETAIARGTTSLSQAAVALAAERLGGLEGRRIVVLGAGDMGEGMATALSRADGVESILVANRTRTKAVALAARIGGTAIELGELAGALEEVDVLLTSTGSPQILLEADDLVPVLPARGGRQLLVVDVAVPRDVDAAVGRLDGVTLLDMDDIRAFAERGVADRRSEIGKVEEIIADEVDRYMFGQAERQVTPAITSLRTWAESVRQGELDRYRSKLDGLDPKQREAVEALTKGILAKLLHEPTVRLKDAAGSPRADRMADTLRTLFDL